MQDDPFAGIFDSLGSILITLFTVFINFLEGLLLFLLSLSDTIIGQIIVFLVVFLVIGNILGDIYKANFAKDSTDKIMENKNKTGFFHPKEDLDVTIEPETVIKFTDVYCGNCNLPIEEYDMFCANCGSLLEDAKAKFLLDNDWDKLSREFYKAMKESP